jgi:hypothetical protein
MKGWWVSHSLRAIVFTCRHISEGEINSLLASGAINQRKSDLGELPCPKLVVDAKVGKGHKSMQVKGYVRTPPF